MSKPMAPNPMLYLVVISIVYALLDKFTEFEDKQIIMLMIVITGYIILSELKELYRVLLTRRPPNE